VEFVLACGLPYFFYEYCLKRIQSGVSTKDINTNRTFFYIVKTCISNQPNLHQPQSSGKNTKKPEHHEHGQLAGQAVPLGSLCLQKTKCNIF
jgi:hypothetical protein